MRILAIETSCDETSAAVVEKDLNQHITVLSNITATSMALHAKTGGIIPEEAAREQIKFILPAITSALLKSEQIKHSSTEKNFTIANEILKEKIDAIAVTYGPGLIGPLLVGVETAKTLAYSLNKPIIPVNHLLAHIFANFIQNTQHQIPNTETAFPFIGLIVSGGHTDLLLFKSLTDYKWLGGTLDDAAGEALDKIGRLLKLSYPAGPEIEERAAKVRDTNIKFKSPVINSGNFDFSFSGLKSEVARYVEKNNLTEGLINEVCYATQKAIVDVLVKKTVRASKLYNVKTILLGGGVSANAVLFDQLKYSIASEKPPIEIFAPQRTYSTDNAAMIGAFALLNYKPVVWQKITALPELYFD